MDFTDIEKIAIQKTLQPLGEIVAEIGMDKPLSAYTRDQVLTLIEVVVGNFQMFVVQHTSAPDDTGIPF
jgi:hypothetical protein